METSSYALRAATPTDREWIYQLNCRCYREVIVQQFGDWNEASARKHFAEKWKPSRFQIVKLAEQAAGILCVIQEMDHWFLSEIVIDPEFQNRGLGTQIVEDLIAETHRLNLPLRLKVLHQNRAKRLYERLGFSKTGETWSHVLMEKVAG